MTTTTATNPTGTTTTTAVEGSARPVSKAALWTGRILSALLVLLLMFSASMKLSPPAEVLKEFERLGYTQQVMFTIGMIELACAILYAIPHTAVFGAIVLAAYLGGATATHVRVGDPFVGPIVIGVVAWIALYLREPRLRPLVLVRK